MLFVLYQFLIFFKWQTTDTCNNLDESQGNYAEWKKVFPKSYILYNSIYITFLNGEIIEKENRWVVARAWDRVGEIVDMAIKGQQEGAL